MLFFISGVFMGNRIQRLPKWHIKSVGVSISQKFVKIVIWNIYVTKVRINCYMENLYYKKTGKVSYGTSISQKLLIIVKWHKNDEDWI